MVEPFEVLLVNIMVVPVNLVAVLTTHLFVVRIQLRQLAESLLLPLLLAPTVLLPITPLVFLLLLLLTHYSINKLPFRHLSSKEVGFILLVVVRLYLSIAGCGQIGGL